MPYDADGGTRVRTRWIRWTNRLDPLLAVVLVAVGTTEAITRFGGAAVPGAAVLAAMAVPVGWRRTRPLVALVGTMAATLLSVVVDVRFYESVAMAVSVGLVVYSVAAGETRRRALAGLLLALVVMPVALAAEDASAETQVAIAVQLVVIWLVGRAVRSQRARVRRSAEAAVRAELDAEQLVTGAVLAERSRMGRELHDIVSHGLSAMVVLATATEVVATDRPDDAVAPLESIQQIGRQTEREVHRFLNLLRRGDDDHGRADAPDTSMGDPAFGLSTGWWPPRGLVADAGLAAVTAVAAMGELVAVGRTEPILVVAGLGQAVALGWRRRAPLVALAIVLAGTAMTAPLQVDNVSVPMWCLVLAVWSCAAWDHRRLAVAGLAGAIAVTLAIGIFTRDAPVPVWPLLIVIVPWGIGRAMRANLAAIANAAEQRVRTHAEAARRASARLDQDRMRLAREVHDIVSHGIAVMVVQAAAAQSVGRDSPLFVTGALQCIQDVGRQTLGEMGRLLELLGEPSVDIDLEPVPDVADIEELVGRVRRSGLPVTLRVDGATLTLPPGVGVTAYRIVQEALTNVGRHASHAATDVTLVFDVDELQITVRNEAGTGTSTSGSGHGLIGIRERVAVCNGDVVMGPVEDGAFLISAKLPIA